MADKLQTKNRFRRATGYAVGMVYAALYGFLTPSMPRWFFLSQWGVGVIIWGRSFADAFEDLSLNLHCASWVARCLALFQLITMSVGVAFAYARSILKIIEYLIKPSCLLTLSNVFASIPYVRPIVLGLWFAMAVLKAIPSMLFSYRGYEHLYGLFRKSTWTNVARAIVRNIPLLVVVSACVLVAGFGAQLGGVGILVEAARALGIPLLATSAPYWVAATVVAQGMAEAAFVLGANVYQEAITKPVLYYVSHLKNSGILTCLTHGMWHLITTVGLTCLASVFFPAASLFGLGLAAAFISAVLWMGLTYHVRGRSMEKSAAAFLRGIWLGVGFSAVALLAVFVYAIASVWLSFWGALALASAVALVGIYCVDGWGGLKNLTAIAAMMMVVVRVVLPESLLILTPLASIMVGYVYWLMYRDMLGAASVGCSDEKPSVSSANLDAPNASKGLVRKVQNAFDGVAAYLGFGG